MCVKCVITLMRGAFDLVARSRGGRPAAEVILREAEGASLLVQELSEVVAHAKSRLGIYFVVPLAEPGEYLQETSQQGREPVGAPALRLLHVDEVGRERLRLLESVHPAQPRTGVGSASRSACG